MSRLLVYLANLLWLVSCLGAWARFLLALRRPAQTQRRLLRRLLRAHRDAAFGRRHGFATIASPAEFSARVPLADYADFAADIAALAAGAPAALTATPVRLLQPTSGSSGSPKLIPYTAALRREFQAAIGPWLAWLYLAHPRLLGGRQYWSLSPNTPPPAAPNAAPWAPRIGFADDTEYLGAGARFLARQLLATPPELARVADPESFTQLTLLYLVGERELRLISVWHPSFLTLLLEALPRHLPAIVATLEHGQLAPELTLPPPLREALQRRFRADPRRAAELRRLGGEPGPALFQHLWPRLAVISCWTDGRVEPWLGRLRTWFPAATIHPKGLVATEGVVSLPTGCGRLRPAALCSHYLEFVEPATGTVRRLHELTAGETYSVVLTTGGGLWRYRLHDLVQVTGLCHRTPCFAFVGKDNGVVDLVGEKLAESHAAEALASAEAATGLRPEFAMLFAEAPESDGEAAGYVLVLELPPGFLSGDAARFAAAVEAGLGHNYHYAHARRLGQLQPLCPHLVSHALARYRAMLTARGMKAGDLKVPALYLGVLSAAARRQTFGDPGRP
jgi:hypothetical protein